MPGFIQGIPAVHLTSPTLCVRKPAIYDSVIRYAAQIGAEPDLIQGAGGNASCKDADTLWIKASGTWLSEASLRDIFVPVGLSCVRGLIAAGASDFSSCVLNNTQLRPSIETSLHALLPHTVVVHVHAVDVLAWSVLHEGMTSLQPLLSGLNWAWVDYVRPGSELARAVSECINQVGAPDIIVLGNHGLVVGGGSVDAVDSLLREILLRTKVQPRCAEYSESAALDINPKWFSCGYRLASDQIVHALAQDPICLALARTRWVLYPDHAVFLGGHSPVAEPNDEPDVFLERFGVCPPCVIIAKKGVLLASDVNRGQEMMIACYVAVTLRLRSPKGVSALTHAQIEELLDWDAEKYRQTLIK